LRAQYTAATRPEKKRNSNLKSLFLGFK
jgi:hypothetical protein